MPIDQNTLQILPCTKIQTLPLANTIDTFDCGEPDLNGFFKEDAIACHEAKLASTHVICTRTEIIGYFTLVNDCLHRQRVNIDDKITYFSHMKYPAIKIARLAIDKKYQRSGLGKWSIGRIFVALSRIADISAFRFLTADAKNRDHVPEFYEKFGFRRINENKSQDTVPMYIDYFALYSYMEKELQHT
ncbi:MAG TPA: GNAT family N-acetyltransferase [Methanocorpusculum sp.]|nr:GNAT family N-acetyltransferase [Methanocorpusculum sp.]